MVVFNNKLHKVNQILKRATWSDSGNPEQKFYYQNFYDLLIQLKKNQIISLVF